MKLQDMLAVLAAAAATMAFTLVTFGPERVGATDQPEAVTPTIVRPKLTVEGCVFTLKTDQPAYAPDETPTLLITAVNPTDRAVETAVWVNISASSPASRISRVMVLPKPLWSSEKCVVSLKPGETKTVTLATDAKLPAGQMISITLSDKDQAVIADLLSVQNNTQSPSAKGVLPEALLPMVQAAEEQ